MPAQLHKPSEVDKQVRQGSTKIFGAWGGLVRGVTNGAPGTLALLSNTELIDPGPGMTLSCLLCLSNGGSNRYRTIGWCKARPEELKQ